MRFLDRLQYKYGRFAIYNLMTYIIAGMGLVYVADMLLGLSTGRTLSQYMMFSRTAIFSGQIWRIISFIMLPPSTSIIFIIFALYFYYLIGNSLEREWGAFKFNVYYFMGVIGTIIAGLITGYATNFYLNMSLFFAFAALYPDFQILLFFIIPLKIKYLAYLDAIYFLYMFVINGWSGRAAIIAALVNFFIFFGPDFTRTVKSRIRSAKARKQFRDQYNQGQNNWYR